MSTQKETIEFILEKLGSSKRFSARAMFGEYALYADGKVVALVCDDQLYVKILPASNPLEGMCEKDSPYPGAKPHYIIEEDKISQMEDLPKILLNIAKDLPIPKKKAKYSKQKK
jgi:TfoX/Sxy family transcriptional regulator of competence genes